MTVAATAVVDVLDRYGVDLDDPDLAAALDAALRTLPRPGTAPLTAAERQFLLENAGFPLTEADLESGEDVQRQWAVAETIDLYASSMTIEEAATSLGVDRSRVSHRLAARQLWSFRLGGKRRIPRWQIVDGRPLPHLAEVVEAAVESDPTQLAGLMTTPQDELSGLTPVQHLLSGRGADIVAALVRGLDEW